MKISSEFSKNASSYDSFSSIQNKVIKKLVTKLKYKPENILDLGCGSGALYKALDWSPKNFLGVDFALGMLELHPKLENVECMYGDFNDAKLFEKLKTYKYDYIFSASALQWAKELDFTFKQIEALNAPISLGIFTSGTFKTLNETANLAPLLLSKEKIQTYADKYFKANVEFVQYKLAFDSVREMFRYIKQSGVSGSRKVLNYKQTKQLMREYPVNYLEFEVAFIVSK